MMKLRCSSIVLLLCSVIAAGQDKPSGECALANAKNGQHVTLNGEIKSTAHDLLLVVPSCESGVVLQYAGDPDTGTSAGQLKRNSNFKRFEKYTSATYKSSGKNLCMQCSKYAVKATLTGRLDVANIPEGATRDQFGFARDGAGKVVGKTGWGHPIPVYKYRLVIEAVSDVVARKLPRPSTSPNALSNQQPATTLLHESGHAEGASQGPQ